MDYFAGLDISMDETHVCVLDREGVVVRESKTASTAEAIAGELANAPTCRRIVFETGRMAPILFHGLHQLGLPVVCVESRQAYPPEGEWPGRVCERPGHPSPMLSLGN
jgi:transposase